MSPLRARMTRHPLHVFQDLSLGKTLVYTTLSIRVDTGTHYIFCDNTQNLPPEVGGALGWQIPKQYLVSMATSILSTFSMFKFIISPRGFKIGNLDFSREVQEGSGPWIPTWRLHTPMLGPERASAKGGVEVVKVPWDRPVYKMYQLAQMVRAKDQNSLVLV